MNANVKPEYKQTEIGVIPSSWDLVRLGDLADFITSGSRGWARYYSDAGALFIRSQNVRDGHLDLTDSQFVRPPNGAEGSRTRVSLNDLLITITGNSVGNVAFVEREIGESYISQHVGLVRLRHAVSAQFICGYLSPGSPGNSQIAGSQSGQSKPGLTLKNLTEFQIALPPNDEQTRIAEALSDMDNQIGSLDQLIAKKRDIKQATMQQLLTGKKRLPGFSGDWRVRTLGELGSTFGGLTGKTKEDFGDGSGQYITFLNVMENVVIDCNIFERVRVSPSESQNCVVRGDLLFNTSSETPEEVAMCALLDEEIEHLYLNSFCFGFRFFDDADADGLFVAYYLRSKLGRELMKSLAQGSTRHNISKSALLKSPLRLPALEEQKAIASALSDMDSEIAALEARRHKAKQLKQGMMQELLTGRIRLV